MEPAELLVKHNINVMHVRFVVKNTIEMFSYCKKKLKLKHLVVEADTPEEVKVFNLVIKQLPSKNIYHESEKTEDGKTQFVLTLGA